MPEKVLSLQATTFESMEQVHALNLAFIRSESKPRDGKAPAHEDGGDGSVSGNGPLTRGFTPPPPPPPPEPHLEDEDDYADPRFHPRVLYDVRRSCGLTAARRSFRDQITPDRRRVWYATVHLFGAA